MAHRFPSFTFYELRRRPGYSTKTCNSETKECGISSSNVSKMITDLFGMLPRIMYSSLRRLSHVRFKILLSGITILLIYLVIFDKPQDLSPARHTYRNGQSIRTSVPEDIPMGIHKESTLPRPREKNLHDMVQEPMDTNIKRTLNQHSTWYYHNKWMAFDSGITKKSLWKDSPEVDVVLKALHTAKIVHVDILNIGIYESGTSIKFVLTLEGGMKAMFKPVWHEKGHPKYKGLCNVGFELPEAEIAAFHLHRMLGYHNLPYVVGRRVNLRTELLPHATPAVVPFIVLKYGEEACLKAKCFYCKKTEWLCKQDGIVEGTITLWVPRPLKLWTYPPGYMPFSTPRMDKWGQYGFNNRTYCKESRSIHPYEHYKYYLDLFDFAAIDFIMYHFDSKHYTIEDNSDAVGLTVRLDHGRAFCMLEQDDEQIFLRPISQCCTLRAKTYHALRKYPDGNLTRELRTRLNKDPIAPILIEEWYPVLERRYKRLMDEIDNCAKANGGLENVLITDETNEKM